MKLDDYSKKRVLFVCVHNSARSQMAEAFLNRLGEGEFYAESAGFEPAPLNPYVVLAMKEIGYDLFGNSINIVNDYFLEGRMYHFIVKVCDQENGQRCPLFPMTRRVIDWNLEDPSSFVGTSEEILDQVRSLRDKIRTLVEDFINEYRDSKLRY